MSDTDMTEDAFDEDDALAAEYCLGVLPGPEQARLARRVETDPAFARRVAAWEDRLTPLAEDFAPETPPPRVKQALDRRLFGQTTPAQSGLWSSLAFWRGIAAVATAAFVLALALPVMQPASTGNRLVASLAAEGSLVTYLVVYDPATGEVSLAHVTGEPVEGRDFQLWVARGSEAPVSLGVIPAAQSTRVEIAAQIQELMTSAAHMAISLEPPGGSPTGQPTGPVLAVGDLLDI